MKLNALLQQTATTRIEFGGEVLTVTYYPNRVTPERAEKVESNEDVFVFACELIKSWDLEEETGVTMPPTLENLRKLPRQIVDEIVGKLIYAKDDPDTTGEQPPSSFAG